MEEEPKTLKKIVDFLIPFKNIDQNWNHDWYVRMKQNYDVIVLALAGIIITTYMIHSVETGNFESYFNKVKSIPERICAKIEEYKIELKEEKDNI